MQNFFNDRVITMFLIYPNIFMLLTIDQFIDQQRKVCISSSNILDELLKLSTLGTEACTYMLIDLPSPTKWEALIGDNLQSQKHLVQFYVSPKQYFE